MGQSIRAGETSKIGVEMSVQQQELDETQEMIHPDTQSWKMSTLRELAERIAQGRELASVPLERRVSRIPTNTAQQE